MNSEELTHKAEEEIAALISKKVAELQQKGCRTTEENRARGFRNRVRAARNDERA